MQRVEWRQRQPGRDRAGHPHLGHDGKRPALDGCEYQYAVDGDRQHYDPGGLHAQLPRPHLNIQKALRGTEK